MRRFIFAAIFATITLLSPVVALAESCCICLPQPDDLDQQGFNLDWDGGRVFTDIKNNNDSKCSTDKKNEIMEGGLTSYICAIKENARCTPPTVEIETLVQQFNFKDVVLGVTIPSLHFSPPPAEVDEDGNIYIPWIGEYIKAVYNFTVIVISILAIVMLIIAGAQIITSAGGPAKGAAYKRITQAIIGLFIAWGSYVVLYTINPGLTQFKSLSVQFIPSDPYTIELGTTEEYTVSEEGAGPAAGSYKEKFTDCPLQLSSEPTFVAPQKEPRTLEFYKQIGQIVTTAVPPTERVIQIANAAAKCGVHFGSCGRTAGTVLALAGFGDSACLNGGAAYRKGCISVKGRTVFSIPYPDRKFLETVRCTKTNTASTCAPDGKTARKIVFDKYKSKMPPEWPDSIADSLQPGDYVIVYNGNTSLRGSHAALFVGWGSGGRAQVIQGSWGKVVSMGTVCIKSSCSSPEALMEITRPQ
jgi:hypothetical protein